MGDGDICCRLVGSGDIYRSVGGDIYRLVGSGDIYRLVGGDIWILMIGVIWAGINICCKLYL